MNPTSSNFDLTTKQYEFLMYQGKRINLLSGSVRSGKTYVSLLKFGLWVLGMPNGTEFIMVGKTIGSLKRNCFNYMLHLFGEDNFKYNMTSKTAYLFGKLVYLEGANDERSEQKIRGMTLAGAYCDEVTLFPESFFTMLLSRLSIEGAKLWATCNPDSPNHYIKQDYIDRADVLNLKHWTFLLTDNKFLPKEYLENLSNEYTGVFYNRFVLGQWVRAEGIIYTKFANNTSNYILPESFDWSKLMLITFGVDFGGNKSATTFVCTGFTRRYENVIILEAERHEEALDPNTLDCLYADFIAMCCTKYGKSGYTYADNEATILIRGLKNIVMKKCLNTIVMNARKMPIFDRISLVNKLINQGRFWVRRHCDTVFNALQNAVWDDKHENERLDDLTSDIDTLDAMEYSIEPHYKELEDYTIRSN